MNKTLKFQAHLIPLILNGQKTSTWRLWDDKSLTVGDVVDFLNYDTKERFAAACLTKVIEKPFCDLTAEDKLGHETYASDEEMLQSFSNCYRKEVTSSTLVKIVWFDLIRSE